jgi:hypothetical protein
MNKFNQGLKRRRTKMDPSTPQSRLKEEILEKATTFVKAVSLLFVVCPFALVKP